MPLRRDPHGSVKFRVLISQRITNFPETWRGSPRRNPDSRNSSLDLRSRIRNARIPKSYGLARRFYESDGHCGQRRQLFGSLLPCGNGVKAKGKNGTVKLRRCQRGQSVGGSLRVKSIVPRGTVVTVYSGDNFTTQRECTNIENRTADLGQARCTRRAISSIESQ